MSVEFRHIRYQGRSVKKPDLRQGVYAGIAGRCPVCGRWNMRVLGDVTQGMEGLERFPDYKEAGIRCCVPCPPTHAVLMARGRVARVDELSKVVIAGVSPMGTALLLHENLSWVIIATQEFSHKDGMKDKTVLQRTGVPLLDAIIEAAESPMEIYVARVLYFVMYRMDEVSSKELVKIPEMLYQYALEERLEQTRVDAMFLMYRSIYRLMTPAATMAIMDKDGLTEQRGMVVMGLGQPGDNPLTRVWPWDLVAYTGAFFTLEESREIVATSVTSELEVVASGNVQDAFYEHLAALGKEKAYSLGPAGVVAVVEGKDVIKSIFLSERGDYLVGYFEVDEPDSIRIPYWVHWKKGYGYSPWQVSHSFEPASDPLLEAALGVFRDLVTSSPESIKSRVVSAKRAGVILKPGEGRAQAEPRVIFVRPGRDAEGRTPPLRRRLPTERKAPAVHGVAGHLRRARRPSEDAVARAKEYGVAVPEGYTWVRPHLAGKVKDRPPSGE